MAIVSGLLSGLLAIGIAVIALCSWLGIVVYGLKAIRRPRPGIALWSRSTMWNPANALLRPELLTDEGQVYRSRCLRALLVFVACVTFGLLVGVLTGGLT